MIKRRARVLAGMALAAMRKVRSKLQHEVRTDRMLSAARERVAHDPTLPGKRVLVTGSTRGIGRSLAEAFVQQGAHVVVHGRRQSEAQDVARQLARRAPSGVTVVGVGADFAVPGSGQTLVADTIAALGGIDVLVNNAGIHDPDLKPFWETGTDEVTSIMRVNVLATFEVSAAAVAHMVEQGVAGRVVSMSTMAARTDDVSSGGIASYGVSKMALEGLVHYLAAEAGPVGITVTALRAGMIDTEMVAPFFPLDKRLRMLPPDSVVAPVVHLATAPHDEVHGRVLDQQDLLERLGGAVTVE